MNLNSDHKKEIKRQVALLKKLSVREKKEKEPYGRGIYQRDYCRILYSSSFRRLQGKMQILGINSSAFFRNRLTHSLEVEQVATSIADVLGRYCNMPSMFDAKNIFVLQAASLAHDIGHPAFGHKGERVLDQLGKQLEHPLRFEGNAQNYRVIRAIEKKHPQFLGLNLTNRVLLAINKYLVKESFDGALKDETGRVHGDYKVKKFMYEEDFNYLQNVRAVNNLENIRTIDVQIIDIADEIAFAVHDLEDGLSLHSFSIDELLYEVDNYYKVKKLAQDGGLERFKQIIDEAKREASLSESFNTLQEYSQVFRKGLTSKLTNAFIHDLTLVEVDDDFAKEHGVKEGNLELRLNTFHNLRKALSKTIFTCISKNPIIELYERRGERIITDLFNLFRNDPKLLPPDFRPSVWPKEHAERIIMDYVSGMMDTFAISQYEHFFNKKFDQIEI